MTDIVSHLIPRSKEANEQRRDTQRARILAAARLIFARQGPAATMDDVATEANISHGLAYRYSPNKDGLFRTLVDEALQAAHAGLHYFEQLPGPAEERLILLISRLIESRRERPDFYLFLDHVRKSPATPAKLKNQIRRQKDALLGLLKRLLVEAQGTGKLHPGNPDSLVMTVSAFLEGLSLIALHEPEDFRKWCPDPEIVLRILIPRNIKSTRGVKR